MTVLVVGSVGYDTVSTPAASGADLLGGSATYFAIAASFFAPVSLIGVVGEDFRPEDTALLRSHGIDVSGLERAEGRTFRWTGEYSAEDVNQRETLDVQLNVFDGFQPRLTPAQRRADYLFLANIDPELQLRTLAQMDVRPRLVAADTINLWIDTKRDALAEVVRSVDVVFMDETEVRTFAREGNLVKAARRILDMGPSAVVAKRGEHGVLMLRRDAVFAAPAFPLERVVDPTGAGDSFAGGFMGYLAQGNGANGSGHGHFRRAAVMGTVMGSFTVQDLSVRRLSPLTQEQAVERLKAFVELTSFSGLNGAGDLSWRGRDGGAAGVTHEYLGGQFEQ